MTNTAHVHLPFIFTYRDPIYGRGFLADVTVRGRLLAEQEAEGWWLYGVNPGGLAAGGTDPTMAHAEFRKSFTSVLFDLAIATNSFESFKQEVEQFFNETNEETLAAWTAAVERVRAGAINLELPRMPAESPIFVTVTMKEAVQLSPDDNRIEPEPALAA